MIERQEVEALLEKMEGRSESAVIETPILAPTLAALCRAWLAVDSALEGSVVESGWNDQGYRMDGRVFDLPTAMIGQRVRIVPVEGDQ